MLALVGLALLSTCGDNPSNPSPPSQKPTRAIRASANPLGVLPFGSKMVDFTLLDQQGQGVARRVLTFKSPTPTSPTGPCCPSIARSPTTAGEYIQVIAGAETTFWVRVTAPSAADLLLPVFVDLKKRGPVEVVPRLQGAPDVVATVSSIRLYFLTGSMYATVDRTPARSWASIAAPGDQSRSSSMFASVSGTMEDTHAIVAHGLDAAEIVKLDGCINLPGGTVLRNDPSGWCCRWSRCGPW